MAQSCSWKQVLGRQYLGRVAVLSDQGHHGGENIENILVSYFIFRQCGAGDQGGSATQDQPLISCVSL